jgi:peroxin-10
MPLHVAHFSLFLQRVSVAISSLSHGAHTLPPRHANLGANENLDWCAAMIKWFLRLHLALFYWNGRYPTFAHRLVGAKFRDGIVPITTVSTYPTTALGTIVANRPSYKPIAAIILFQALATLTKTTADASIEVAHFFQVAFFRWRRRRRIQQQRQRNDIFSVGGNIEREEYLDMIEDRVPSMSSSEMQHTPAADVMRKQPRQQRGHQCGICLNERVHPAAPTACGHVFCWDCVLHWVLNVRAECPLCRAGTRPQDIIPLYNYA